MSARVFVDTNVLLYRVDSRDLEKQGRAEHWLKQIWSTRSGRLSYQVLQEFYAVATRKLDPGLDPATARSVIEPLLTWRPILTDDRVLRAAWDLEERFSLSWWDALIVAAAQVTRSTHLLTEDLQAGQRFGDLEVVDPFSAPPSEILAG